jgi:hypothetical protein
MKKATKVISHDNNGFNFIKNKNPDNTHSIEKNGGSNNSPLEKYKSIKKEENKDYFV